MKKSFLLCAAFCSLVGPLRPVGAAGKPVDGQFTKQVPGGETLWKFNFGVRQMTGGYVAVTPETLYAPNPGYGFEPGAEVNAGDMACTSGKPFLFSAAVPEGNYRVTVRFGDKNGETNTTVKAEARRLMVENVATTGGEFQTRSFVVNVRTPKLPAGGSVKLNDREIGALNWDEKLTLEFDGARPSIASVEIARVDVPTVFLAGDSTVTDQAHEPYAAWGQMLPRFFKPTVAIANYAESGLTLGSFRGQKRLAKLLSVLKSGDYVFVQFGHNDQKDKGEGAGPFTSYKTNLKDYVAQIRGAGGVPVVVTPMERRRWSGGKPEPTLAEYAAAARQVGEDDKVPVIDLNAMSLAFYTALGPENTTKAFVFFALGSFPGQKEALKDNTHFNNYGAYELAKCVTQGIRQVVPALVASLTDDSGPFDPATPDPVEGFRVPHSPYKISEKPAGS